jgi:hypothetical protein
MYREMEMTYWLEQAEAASVVHEGARAGKET